MFDGPHIPNLLNAQKFLDLSRIYGSRVIHQRVDPCPNGNRGCRICLEKGYYTGFHHRPIPIETFHVDLLNRPSEDGEIREIVPHRYRTGLASAFGLRNNQAADFQEGVDFTIEGRNISWVNPPDYQTNYRLTYDAFPEADVNLIHVVGDFAGESRKAETNTFHRLGALEQGEIGISIPKGQLLNMKLGDRITPVDGTMTFTETLQVGQYNPSRHRFVTKVLSAFAIPYLETEEPIDVAFDAVAGVFVIDNVNDLDHGTLVTVVYEACPTYEVRNDMGEFRTVLGQQQPRLAVLTRLELAQGQR